MDGREKEQQPHKAWRTSFIALSIFLILLAPFSTLPSLFSFSSSLSIQNVSTVLSDLVYILYCYSFPLSLDNIFFPSLFSLNFQHSYPHLFTHCALHTFSFVSWTIWGHCGFKPCCAVLLHCYATSPTSPNLPLTQYNISTHTLSLSLTQEGSYTSQKIC